jgi:UDP-N-acetylmuramate dehydrogenase
MYNKEQNWKDIINCNLDNEIRRDVSMKNYTSWKIGGNADFFCIPSSEAQLIKIIQHALNNGLPFYIIGQGSNIWVPEQGIRGLVIRIAQTLDKIEYSDKIIKAGAGILLPVLGSLAAKQGLGGLEFAAHIPGTLGGAIINNASFGNESMSGIVSEINLYDYQSNIVRNLKRGEFSFLYRDIDLGYKKAVILGAILELTPSNEVSINVKIKKNYEQRKALQPINFSTSGCIFKNPVEKSAGYLIEKAGGKGLTVGDAQVSTKHANFIINRGQASADDILKLVEIVETLVKNTFDIKLEREIKFIGLDN